ncbi:PREDICTED: small glutamine-rich tetratricopeptide repeat-containing protein isoform X1 [Nicotiana attenuata]|uniref:Serinethreonine-protein phosphatase 5 n=1 Tax=Nicotiana attenuata TaxID=49451 RepID=A0A314KZX8_NICAT|nr:PREDICTED: small glutamine-rich tetratricopeptide repeat-containing protein isoform X1 [Nicotiana attenuata]OIT34880.1 serinethreonine-protein phosphatase 5 [Nicotiana attenuata]
MAKLKTDSPLSRRIVLSFLHFLDSVEPASGVDDEGLEVVKQCLSEAFKIDPSSAGYASSSDSLVDIFSSREAIEQSQINLDLRHDVSSSDDPCSSSGQKVADAKDTDGSQFLAEERTKEAPTFGISKDELFGQFFDALEKAHYFRSLPDGKDDQAQLDRASRVFHTALEEMQKSGCAMLNRNNLAETLKSQGNKAMQSKLYSDAIELYTFAIALCEDNAVYHCNRAAALTQIHEYEAAVQDCLKSTAINPNYSKAYSRLGFVYYAQGKYRDAIDKGFTKALQLDPNNDSIKENIRVAEQKLKEEQQKREHDQSSTSASHGQESNQQPAGASRSHAMPPPFASMSFDGDGISGIPDLTNVFMNMTRDAFQGQHGPNGSEGSSDSDSTNEPGIRLGRNINVNFGEQMPEELTGALRSVMEMFSGAQPPRNPQDSTNGRSTPN